ncbi:2-amino-4-hydroxy-6-hydroxymethyldihydropteridine diphosphokinase [Roseobacter sp. WL0113]|uniref:2-amino-4-hydroxy-6-hydroxymethyldihydropteridine pyrophosphokinase n=1 Tax=Roseobacter sinensis TaxID=2931391 RepID=A0ABT3BDD2_9RHOB|nr:2-amino-4-hydroxy-6-hydroxymethyldihydropteridine diphosphokinase [Roseobacter sp. WL0113]
MPQSRTIALVAVGSNRASGEGLPEKVVKMAIAAVVERLGVIRAESRLFRTPAFPPGNGPDYVNAALSVETALPPVAILEALHMVEAQMGRTRVKRWDARTLDLDLIGVGDILLPDAATQARWRALPLEDQLQTVPDELILPHPRLQERAFVLVPLADVAPDWVHPALDKTVVEMLDQLPAALKREVKAL